MDTVHMTIATKQQIITPLVLYCTSTERLSLKFKCEDMCFIHTSTLMSVSLTGMSIVRSSAKLPSSTSISILFTVTKLLTTSLSRSSSWEPILIGLSPSVSVYSVMLVIIYEQRNMMASFHLASSSNNVDSHIQISGLNINKIRVVLHINSQKIKIQI